MVQILLKKFLRSVVMMMTMMALMAMIPMTMTMVMVLMIVIKVTMVPLQYYCFYNCSSCGGSAAARGYSNNSN